MTFARRLRPFVAAASLAGAALAGEEAPDAVAPIRREIRVRLACDEEFQLLQKWEARARGRLAEASLAFEMRFGIRWKAVGVTTWRSDDAASTLGDLLDQLERDVPRGDVDVVVGLTGQKRAKGSRTSYDIAGRARFYGPCAILRESDVESTPRWYAGALAHELGHVMGAWHCRTMDSVMQESGGRRSSEKFDAQSAAAIEALRDLDFSRGLDALDEATRKRLGEIYRGGHAPAAALPYVEVELSRARKLSRTDAVAARAVFLRALTEQEAWTGPEDASLLLPLRMFAHAWTEGRGRDLDEAERLARRALAISTATGVAEDPPLASEFVLANVARQRGRKDEAAAGYRKVHEARVKAGGEDHPDAVRVKKALDDLVPPVPPKKPWQDVVVTPKPAPPPEEGLAFEAPRDGTIHLRPARDVAAPPKGMDSDAGAFEVAAPLPGELRVRWTETEAGGTTTHRFATRVETGRPAVVGFEYASIDDGRAAAVQYVGRLFAGARGAVSTTSFGCEAPAKAVVCVRRGPPLAVSGFARLPYGPTCLLSRQWVEGDADAKLTFEYEEGDVLVVNGVRVGADGSGGKRAWRLELMFVPDEGKK